MNLRPVPARWFELLVQRDDLTVAMDVLARSRQVELESHGKTGTPLRMSDCRELLEEAQELEHRFGRHWPPARRHGLDERGEPYVMLQSVMRRLRAWTAEAPALIDELEHLLARQSELERLAVLFRDAVSLPELDRFARAGPMLETCVYLVPGDEWPQSTPGSVITRRVTTPEANYLLGIGQPGDLASLGRELHLMKARRLHLPEDVPASAQAAEEQMSVRLSDIRRRVDAARHGLELLHQKHDLADALADIQFVRWYVENVPDLTTTENFAWVTGWTSEADEGPLLRALAGEKVKGVLHLTEPPPGFEAPLLLRNPAWMRPFELFTKMIGVPGSGDVDPTRVVAIFSPLMFGYMFGDVGQGAVLMIAGIVLSRRYPALRLLVAGGAMSIVFGFVFGSFFALEHVIAPLWMHPFEDPILILIVPMAGGAVLLLVGMCLDALQAHWQRRAANWWETQAGLVLCYLALLGAMLDARMLWLVLPGAAWFVFGHALVAEERRLAACGSAVAEFLELLLQLVVNTISFVRVGAFALAHAGLSIAVVGVAEAPASLAATLVVLVLGNVLIIGLEGLVVGIQTTRLLLFEFFVRFLSAEGRPFRPMPPHIPHPGQEHRRPQ